MEQKQQKDAPEERVRSSDWLGDAVEASLSRMSMPSTHPALWITCSPHEWTWKQAEQEEMARDCVNFAREICRLRRLVQTERAIARGAQENATGFREICERQEGEIKAAKEELRAANEIGEGIIAARNKTIERLRVALRDAISTYGPAEHIVVTAERIEAWQDALHGGCHE